MRKKPFTPSLNHPVAPPKKPAKASGAKKRSRIRQVSPKRAAENVAYEKHKRSLPDDCVDPWTGERFLKSEGEPHHPGLRWKKCFCFVVYVTPYTHRVIHEYPDFAEGYGLLFKGRTTRACTPSEAREMLTYVPYPESFAIALDAWVATLK